MGKAEEKWQRFSWSLNISVYELTLISVSTGEQLASCSWGWGWGMLQPELVLPETSYPDSTPPPVLHPINMLKLQGPGGGRIKRTPPDPSFIACACVYMSMCVLSSSPCCPRQGSGTQAVWDMAKDMTSILNPWPFNFTENKLLEPLRSWWDEEFENIQRTERQTCLVSRQITNEWVCTNH